uniref:Ig-like domain-containing protein n=1 Tax=Parastrongyloides trichosuri TaxID=131310 RepID=A0A0N4ZLZ1_PARTI
MTISSIKLTARMLLMLLMVTTVGCSLFPSAPSGITDKNISYELRHNSPSDVIMVKCPGRDLSLNSTIWNFVYETKLDNMIALLDRNDGEYVWMAWKKEDISLSNLNVQCGYFDVDTGENNFKRIFWNIKVVSTSTTKFLENVNLLFSTEAAKYSIRNINIREILNNQLLIILRDRNGKLSYVENIRIEDFRSKNIYYFFDIAKIRKDTELLTPSSIVEIYHVPPTISIEGNQLVKIEENDGIKVMSTVKAGENKYLFKLMSLGSQDLINFYQGEKVLIKKMLYRNGKAEVKEEKGIEVSESFTVTGYEILEISYKSLSKDRKYEIVKEVIFFGPVNKNLELKAEIINITAADVPYQLSCSYTKFDYAYLYQVMVDKDVMDVGRLTTDGIVFGDFTRSGDLVKYKPVDVDKMDWACIYKTPNGKVIVPYLFVRKDRYRLQYDYNGNIVLIPTSGNISKSKPSFFYGFVIIAVLSVLLIIFLVLLLIYRRKIKHHSVVAKKTKKIPVTSKPAKN